MAQRENVFYDVPEWDAVRDLCAFDITATDEELLAKVARLGEMIPEAIAACEMLANKALHLEAAQDDDFMLDEEFSRNGKGEAIPVEERHSAATKKADGVRHALSHLKARTNYMIAAHGDMRAIAGFDPVFTVRV